MKKIFDVCDSAVLATSTIEDLIDETNAMLGADVPDVVCVPLVDFGGANYESRLIDRNLGPWSGEYDLGVVVKLLRERYECQVYLSIICGMDFIDVRPFKVRDQYNDDKTGVCIVNPYIQKLLRGVIEEAQNKFEPDGFVLDICDQYGQNAEDGRIDFTCFCSHCIEALREHRFDYTVFQKHPNPVNLTLKDTGTGIKHFTMNPHLREAELVEKSKVEGIFNPEWFDTEEEALEAARLVLDYVRARSKIVANAISAIGRDVRKADKRLVVVTNSSRFDWTTHVVLSHLQGHADEVWTDSDDLSPAEIPANIEVYQYLYARARYMIDAYFELASNIDKLSAIAAGITSARMGVRDLLEDRSSKILGANQVKLSNIAALEMMGTFSGYVAPTLSASIIKRINDRLLQLFPGATEQDRSAGAEQILLFLMQLAQRGQPITLEVLQDIAIRLGIFSIED